MWYKLKRIMMRPNGVEKQVRPSVVTETYTMAAKTQSSWTATDYTSIYKSWKTIKQVVIETTFNKVWSWANNNFWIATDSTSSNSFYLNSNGIWNNNYCKIEYSVNWWGWQSYRSWLSWLDRSWNNTAKFTIGRDSAILELNWTTNSYTYWSSEATFVQWILDSATAQFIYNFTASAHWDVTITVTYN